MRIDPGISKGIRMGIKCWDPAGIRSFNADIGTCTYTVGGNLKSL